MKIVVLAGGLSPERNVSLSSGTMIAKALYTQGHQVALVDMFFGIPEGMDEMDALFSAPVTDLGVSVDPTAPDLNQIRASRPGESRSHFGPGVLALCQQADLVFLALHGQCGEDGRVQATFDLLGIPYTGSGYLASALALDKDLTKQLVKDAGVKTPSWEVATYTEKDIDHLTSVTRVPCVVKPIDSGSSIGVSIAQTKKELRLALLQGLEFGGRCVLEQYVAGREIQVGVLEGKALPPIEIRPNQGFYDYENKYQPGAAEEICPAPIAPGVTRELQQATMLAYRTLGLRVYARADFIVDGEGTPWFLEINTLPGMTPTSLLPQEAAVEGIDYPQLCQRIAMTSLAYWQAGNHAE